MIPEKDSGGYHPSNRKTGACRGPRRIRFDVSKLQVQSHQNAALSSTARDYNRVIGAGEVFVANRVGLKANPLEKLGVLLREVFVDLEFQTLDSRGRFTVPSRVSSAA